MRGRVIVLYFHTSSSPEQSKGRACWPASPRVERWVDTIHLQPLQRRPAMIRLSRLPEEVARLLAPLKPYFSYRHYAVFCWLVVAHLVWFEKATLPGLARYVPSGGAAWHLRRLLAAGRSTVARA